MCHFFFFRSVSDGGAWSTRGSRLVKSTTVSATCEFDHTTNFAILMSPAGTVCIWLHILFKLQTKLLVFFYTVNINSQTCILKPLKETGKCGLYEQLPCIYMLKLCALFIKGENETALYRQWFVIWRWPFKAGLTVFFPSNICCFG